MPSRAHPPAARRFIAALLCLGSIAGMTTLAAWWNGSGGLEPDDHSRGNQADVWAANPDADESVVAIDTNFDGRPDERLRYRHGDLVSREIDSDFDTRVDIVEEFDPVTHEVVRSLIDIDEDGQADLLVLSQNGRPVFQKWAERVAPPDAHALMATSVTSRGFASAANPAFADGDLIPLADPFVGDVTVRSSHPWRAGQRDSFLSTSGGLPLPAAVMAGVGSSGRVPPSALRAPSALAAAQASPRGPPSSSVIPTALL